jgi:hypothetical protein
MGQIFAALLPLDKEIHFRNKKFMESQNPEKRYSTAARHGIWSLQGYLLSQKNVRRNGDISVTGMQKFDVSKHQTYPSTPHKNKEFAANQVKRRNLNETRMLLKK